ncbi:hypothetical protein RF11_01323 [Thelohanellus kitauei]|uniref:Uncharacterized protein n=1 Tax=Thelohanellus kitauei TaxID=669202 RepID=A0A0C2JKU9_THEKT|nr:hypothetical protein RF11_01323 [Thelohanellus kitauei]
MTLPQVALLGDDPNIYLVFSAMLADPFSEELINAFKMLNRPVFDPPNLSNRSFCLLINYFVEHFVKPKNNGERYARVLLFYAISLSIKQIHKEFSYVNQKIWDNPC